MSAESRRLFFHDDDIAFAERARSQLLLLRFLLLFWHLSFFVGDVFVFVCFYTNVVFNSLFFRFFSLFMVDPRTETTKIHTKHSHSVRLLVTQIQTKRTTERSDTIESHRQADTKPEQQHPRPPNLYYQLLQLLLLSSYTHTRWFSVFWNYLTVFEL